METHLEGRWSSGCGANSESKEGKMVRHPRALTSCRRCARAHGYLGRRRWCKRQEGAAGLGVAGSKWGGCEYNWLVERQQGRWTKRAG